MVRVHAALVIGIALVASCGRIGYDGVGGGDATDAPADGPAACVGADCVVCTPRAFADDFEDGVRGSGWADFDGVGGSLVETGGHVVITAGIEDQAYYETFLLHDLRTQEVSVRLVSVGVSPPRSDGCLSVRDPDYEFASICVENSGATLVFRSPGASPHSVPFTAATASWWRIRRGATAFLFSTSADGVTWAADVSLPIALPITNPMHARIGVSNYSGPTTTAVYTFDTFRVGAMADNVTGTAEGCAPGWSDDFEDGVLAPRWESFADPGSSATESGGAIEVIPPLGAGQNGFARVRTLQYYDLRSAAVSVALDHTLAGGDANAGFEVDELVGGEGAGFVIVGATLYTTRTVGFGRESITNVPYSGTAHRVLRLRHDGTMLHWETSPDGLAWTALHADATSLDAHAVRVVLFAEKNVGAATGRARFDDLTTTP